MTDMRSLPFGMENEMTGITREQAAQALARLWNTAAIHEGGSYDIWNVPDPEGKTWKLVYDSSIRKERRVDAKYESTENSAYSVEMVTPVLGYAEIPKMQQAIRALKEAGAKVNDSCGLHVHIGSGDFDSQSLKNLLSIMYSKEDLLFKALKTPESRVRRWCQPVNENTLRQIRNRITQDSSLSRVADIWYEGSNSYLPRSAHYHESRYHALNLHSVFYRGTLEYRLFNATLHAGRAKAYVHLALSISAQALNQRGSQMRKTVSDNEAFTFRTWLLRMGMIGDEFKNTREHLLSNLEGDRAWRYDRDHYEKPKPTRSEPVR